MWAIRAAAAALVAVAVATVGVPLPAQAHASLVSSDPTDHATLDAVPQTVSLTFDEPVESAYVAVTGPDGSALADGDAQVADVRVEQPLAASTLQGTYTLAFRVVSHDGHPVTQTLHFDVGHASTPADTADDLRPAAVGGDSFIREHVGSLTIAMAAVTLALCLAILKAARSRRERTES
jgi:methionine-rich copper-binding protein CopC